MNRSFFRKTVFVVITALLFAGCGYDEIKENPEENGIETSDSDSLSPAEDLEAPVSSDTDEDPAEASEEEDPTYSESDPEPVIEEAPEADPEPVIVQNPSWEYYCDDSLTEASSHISLVKISQKTNGIVDDDDWFESLGITRPGREYQSDNDHYFHMYGGGDVGFEPDTLEISDTDGSMIAVLDFYAFYTPDTCYSHPAFVSETIHSPKIEEGILYISTFHNTYASSAPHNGYIMAIDMNDGYKVLWKTEPLTCNAENFVIAGDTIICGYGFTDEDDFIYLLDKNTGKRIDTIKIKTGPEYFHLTDNNLYVRTYDTDYIFKINR